MIDLTEGTFQRVGFLYLVCKGRNAFFTSEEQKKVHILPEGVWSPLISFGQYLY